MIMTYEWQIWHLAVLKTIEVLYLSNLFILEPVNCVPALCLVLF